MINIQTNRPIRMSDPRLPMTVSRAAIELDNASRGEAGSFEATRRLGEFLRTSLHLNMHLPNPVALDMLNVDVNAMDVVGDALINIGGQADVKTVQDVIREAWTLVSNMDNASFSTDFDHLKEFCIAFGNSLLAYRANLEEEDHVNPYRR